MVNVGVIGLGPVWETRYRPVLQKLASKIQIRAVYDCVAEKARLTAEELHTDAAPSILALIERADVRAILVCDPAWTGIFPLKVAVTRRKPVFAAGPLTADIDELDRLYRECREKGITLMPELGARYTPASGRLQELIATRLGRPQRIAIESGVTETDLHEWNGMRAPKIEALAKWFDWCRYVARSTPESVNVVPLSSSPNNAVEVPGGGAASRCSHLVQVQFGCTGSKPSATIAELTIGSGEDDSRLTQPPTATSQTPRIEIDCENGQAIVEGSSGIRWISESESHEESLGTERSEVEVMLDHFCRRVVGGLIPVADLEDIRRGLHLVYATRESLQTGRLVNLNGQQ